MSTIPPRSTFNRHHRSHSESPKKSRLTSASNPSASAPSTPTQKPLRHIPFSADAIHRHRSPSPLSTSSSAFASRCHTPIRQKPFHFPVTPIASPRKPCDKFIPMVQVAKQHLATLEELWGEISGIPMSSSLITSLNGWRKRTISVSPPSPGRRLRTTSSQSTLSANENNPFIVKTPKDFPNSNDKAMTPIVEALEKMISEEMERRKIVEEEIQALKSQIREKCEALSEPVRFYINAETASKKLTIFQCRDALKSKLAILETMFVERKSLVEEITEKIRECRATLTDLRDDEFVMEVQSGLSLETLRVRSECLEALEREKERRTHDLVDSLEYLALIVEKLGYLKEPLTPSVSFGGHILLSFLNKALTVAATLDGIDLTTKVRTVITKEIFETRDFAECPFDLSRLCIMFMRATVDATKTEFKERLGRCQQAMREVQIFWAELGVPTGHKGVELTEDVKRLEEYQSLADELRVRWRQKMEEALVNRMERLKVLWNRCHVAKDEMDGFMSSISENFYSPLTLETIETEIRKLEERLKREKPILELVDDRYAFIQKLKDFEISASDPKRLFHSSFRLMEEEKFRKTGVPTLLNKEEKLRKAVLAFEQANYPFFYEGIRFLEVLENEISDRFVNEALVIFDSTLPKSPHLRQSHSSHTTKSPRTPTASAPTSPTLRRARSAVLGKRDVTPTNRRPGSVMGVHAGAQHAGVNAAMRPGAGLGSTNVGGHHPANVVRPHSVMGTPKGGSMLPRPKATPDGKGVGDEGAIARAAERELGA